MLCCLQEEQEALDEMRYYQQLPWEAEEALNAGVSAFSIVTTEVSRNARKTKLKLSAVT